MRLWNRNRWVAKKKKKLNGLLSHLSHNITLYIYYGRHGMSNNECEQVKKKTYPNFHIERIYPLFLAENKNKLNSRSDLMGEHSWTTAKKK